MIIHKPIKNIFAFGILLLIPLFGEVVVPIELYKIFMNQMTNSDLVMKMLIFIVCLILTWYIIVLFKCNYYMIELSTNGFLHKVFIARRYDYSDIEDIYIVEYSSRQEDHVNILIIKTIGGKKIRLRLDRLQNDQRANLVNTFKNRAKIDTVKMVNNSLRIL